MQCRANSYPLPLRVFLCLLTLILLIPPCFGQPSATHSPMSDGMTATAMPTGMDCCPSTTAIQAPNACCTLHPQPAELSSSTPALSIPNISSRVLPALAAVPHLAPRPIRTTASQPLLLHPILRI